MASRGTGGTTKVSIELAKHRDEFITRLRQRETSESSYTLACETMKYLRRLIGQGRYGNFRDLLELVKSEGELLVKADPTEFLVGNMVLRVLKLIREEHTRLMSGKDEIMNLEDPHDSLHKLWEREDKDVAQITAKELKAAVVESVTEFMTMDLQTCTENIAAQSIDHIQDGDVVLTLGNSHSVEAFLKNSAKKSSFTVMVADNAPADNGALLAEKFRGSSITVTAINDASIFAKMPKVTKVILGAHAILADGGFIGASGMTALCLAAKRYSVPVIVLASFYKLTPKFLADVDQETFNRLQSPRKVIAFSEGDLVHGAEVVNVAFDFIPPQLVSLFITHTAGNSPSYVYRLLTENYHPEDITNMSSQKA